MDGRLRAGHGGIERQPMWYFSWILGLGFAVTLAVLNAMWLEVREPPEPE